VRVDVAIALPGAAPFTYQVPAELADAVRPGIRVRVPFGSGQRIGLVTGQGSARGLALKPVLEAIDAEPVLSPGLLDLTRWVASYYRCGWGEAIRAALPPGMDAQQVRTVFAGDGLAAAMPDRGSELAAYLAQRTAVSYEFLVRRFGRTAAAEIEALRAAGLAGVYQVWRKARIRAKSERWLAVRPGVLDNPRATAQTRLWRRLRECGSLPPAELAGARPAAARLVSLGLAAWEERPVDRLPALPDWGGEAEVTDLTREQGQFLQEVSADIDRRAFAVRLLLGVTAGGKTELYLRAAGKALAAGRQALILVPEIGLTHQMVGRVRAALGRVAVLHSGMSGGERFDAWRLIREKRFPVVIGTRSAVFAPLDDLGLVVIDEEQDPSYKQEDCRPHYHARDAAIVRARACGATVILGSATPSIETYHKALGGKFALSLLTVRPGGAVPPAIEIVDLQRQPGQAGILSLPLVSALRQCVAGGEQAMLLLNRRGLAPFVQCDSCGGILRCPNCSVSLTLHRRDSRLLCHYCGHARELDRHCPECRHLLLVPRGWGIQQLEQEVRRLLPGEPVLRMDADTTARKGAHQALLGAFRDGRARVMIGTQMIAKGHHFPRVTLVGVVNIDDVLGFPDFRAAERAYQLLHQMAGRAGRGGSPGRVLVQTRIAGHPVLAHAARHDFQGFARWELAQRGECLFPPFCRIALVTVSSPSDAQAERTAAAACRALSGVAGVCVLGPSPALLSRLRGRFRWQLLLKYQRPSELDAAVAALPAAEAAGAGIEVAVDPVSLM